MIVACVWVEGNVPFTADYVSRLRNMVRRNLPLDHRFVCFTDRPYQIPDIESRVIPTPQGMFGWWAKLHLFAPGQTTYFDGDTILYLDLDVLVVNSLYPLAQIEPPELMLVPDEGVFQGGGGRRVIKKYNSSVMLFPAAAHCELFTRWTPAVTERLWGDQDWIAEVLPNLVTMPARWFPRISNIGAEKHKAAGARIVLCKRPKNHIAAAMWPWVRDVWV